MTCATDLSVPWSESHNQQSTKRRQHSIARQWMVANMEKQKGHDDPIEALSATRSLAECQAFVSNAPVLLVPPSSACAH